MTAYPPPSVVPKWLEANIVHIKSGISLVTTSGEAAGVVQGLTELVGYARTRWYELQAEEAEPERLQIVIDAVLKWQIGMSVRIINTSYKSLAGKMGKIVEVQMPVKGQTAVMLHIRLDSGPRKSPRYCVDGNGNLIYHAGAPYGLFELEVPS